MGRCFLPELPHAGDHVGDNGVLIDKLHLGNVSVALGRGVGGGRVAVGVGHAGHGVGSGVAVFVGHAGGHGDGTGVGAGGFASRQGENHHGCQQQGDSFEHLSVFHFSLFSVSFCFLMLWLKHNTGIVTPLSQNTKYQK